MSFDEINLSKKGFTLIELLSVIAILGILVLLAVQSFSGLSEKAKIAQIQSDVKTLETIVSPEMAMNEGYLENSGWPIADNSELDKHQATSSLFNREGRVEDGSVNLDEIYYELPSNTFNSELKGQFYMSQGGEAYYFDETFKEDLEIKTLSMEFEETLERSQTHTFNLPRLFDLESITSDNGDVEILNVDGNEVTIRIKGGDIKNQVLTGGEYIPEEVKEVEAQNSEDYDKDGFTGELERYLYSGELIPKETKTATDSVTKTSNSFSNTLSYNSGGFTGSLSKNGSVSSNRQVTGSYWQDTGRYEDQGYYEETGYMEGIYEKRMTLDTSACGPGYPDANGMYAGITGCGWGMENVKVGERWVSTGQRWVSTGSKWVSTGGYWANTYTTYYTQNYSGTVTKPEVDTREYRYKGTVVKPESDTRTYDNYYQYNITVRYK